MKLYFKTIDIENFLSIGKAHIKLDNRGYCLIKGKNNCKTDFALSNGAGKSSIIDSIIWCLTGETSRGIKDVTNIYAGGGTKVECNFIVDQKEYKITRIKGEKTDLKIFINGEDKSGKGIKDSTLLLEKYLPGLSFRLLSSVIFLGQGLPERLSSNTPAKRKELLEIFSQSDFMIEDVKNRINKRREEIENDIKISDRSLVSLDAEIMVYKSSIEKLQRDLSNLRGADELLNEKNKATNELKLISEQNDLYKASLQGKVDESELVNNSLLEAISHQNDYLKDENIVNLQNKIDTLRTDAINLSVKINETKKQILQYESVKDICPTCGQKLPNVIKLDTSGLRAELSTLESEYNNIVSEGKKLKNEYDKMAYALSCENSNKQKTLQEKASKLKCEIKEKQSLINVNEQNIKTVSAKINNIDIAMATLDKEKQNILNQITQNNKNIEITAEKQSKIKADAIKLNERKDVILRIDSLVKKDFRGYLLEGVISYIDKKAKEYCRNIFNTDKVSFKLSGNNVDISYNNKIYEALSGGEKQKVDIIIQLSLRAMLCSLMDFSSNIIAFDEIFDNLDSIGCNNIIDLITNKLSDIETIFIISHHTDISIPSDCEITVVKNEDGISYIE